MGQACVKGEKKKKHTGSRRLSLTNQPAPQFELPPHVKCEGDYVSSEHKLSYAAVSVAGTYFQPSLNPFKGNTKYKTNQDSYFMVERFNDDDNMTFFGVLDGHGSSGHFASQYVAKQLPIKLETKVERLKNSVSPVMRELFLDVDNDLENSEVDVMLSGSTCTVGLMIDSTLYVGNAGDSRCVLATRDGTKYVTKELSNDHKPELEEEKKRIEAHNGRVAPLDSWPEGPHRVWLRTEDLPGLAMSRSFGDRIAHSVGVSTEPEVIVHEVDRENDAFLILASDGVWEFVSSEEAVMMVKDMPTPKSAADLLCKVSVERWGQEEPVCDDITALVIFLNR